MVINQPFGIGDILFIEPILRHFWKKNGEKPILPVRDHLMWLSEYIESARFVKMSEFKLDYDSMDMSNPTYLPLRFANQIYRGYGPNDHHDFENMMLDKYRLCGLDEDLWKTLQIKFDIQKSRRLASDLDLVNFSETSAITRHYICINENCGIGTIKIDPITKAKQVRMSIDSKYGLMDWFSVIYHASENHHVSTSTFFILQAIKNQYPEWNVPCYIYPRPNEDGLRGISQLKPSFEYKIGKL